MAEITNNREKFIGIGTHILGDTVKVQASKLDHPVNLSANFETLTPKEQEKFDQQVFPKELMFHVDVDLVHSKKAWLNFVKGLDDTAVYDQLWDLRPHNPHTYEAPIGMQDIAS